MCVQNVDMLHLELKTRTKFMDDIRDSFEVLLSVNLIKANDDTFSENISRLTECYDEFSQDEVKAKIKILRRIL